MSIIYKIPENITYESIDNNIYILNIENGKYFKLSDSASLIWNEIVKGICVEDIKTHLKFKFSDSDRIDDDVDETISQFINLGLIKDN